MDTTTTAQNQPPVAATEDKTVAIVSYLTLIGFIVALIIHNGKKTKLGAYHLRQLLGFFLTAVALGFCMGIVAFIPILNILGLIAYWIAMICMFVLWIMGLIAAINGEMKPMPLVGAMYQKWFGTTFD
jgi:uncharacterized membrane protein